MKFLRFSDDGIALPVVEPVFAIPVATAQSVVPGDEVAVDVEGGQVGRPASRGQRSRGRQGAGQRARGRRGHAGGLEEGVIVGLRARRRQLRV